MNKLTKGTIAGAAAVALLLGGGTVLAYWNDSINLGGQTAITAGTLKLGQKTAPKWELVSKAAPAVKTDVTTQIGSLRIVPGDKLIYTGSYEISAAGRDLTFEASVAPQSIHAADTAKAEDKALATRLAQTNTVTIASGPAASVTGGTVATTTITSTGDAIQAYPVTISVELNWPFDEAPDSPSKDNPAKNGAVSLADFTIQVTQK